MTKVYIHKLFCCADVLDNRTELLPCKSIGIQTLDLHRDIGDSKKVANFIKDREVMAQSASTFPQSIKNPPPSVRNLQQVQQNQEYIVVHQQPPTRSERFPYSLSIKCIFGFSIAECVIASIMIIVGTAIRVMGVGYHTTYIALPIWCGLVVSV